MKVKVTFRKYETSKAYVVEFEEASNFAQVFKGENIFHEVVGKVRAKYKKDPLLHGYYFAGIEEVKG